MPNASAAPRSASQKALTSSSTSRSLPLLPKATAEARACSSGKVHTRTIRAAFPRSRPNAARARSTGPGGGASTVSPPPARPRNLMARGSIVESDRISEPTHGANSASVLWSLPQCVRLKRDERAYVDQGTVALQHRDLL